MPINFQPMDFSRYFQRQNDDSRGIRADDIFGSIERGLRLGSLPFELMQKKEQQDYINKIKGAEAKYAEPSEKAKMEKQRADAIYRQLEADYYPESTRADIDYKKALMQNVGAGSLTQTQRELRDIYGAGTPEYREALKAQYGIVGNEPGNMALQNEFGPEPIGIPYARMNKNEQTYATKENDKDLNTAAGMTETIKTLDKIDEIFKKNPKISDSLAAAFLDPNEKGIKSYVTRKITNKKDQDDVLKMAKLSGDLVVKGGQALGGSKNFTDARQALLERIKPSDRLTENSAKFVIQHLRDQMLEGPAWEKAIRAGQKQRIRVLRDPDRYKALSSKFLSEPRSSMKNSGHVLIEYNGQTRRVPSDRADAAIQAGGRLVE